MPVDLQFSDHLLEQLDAPLDWTPEPGLAALVKRAGVALEHREICVRFCEEQESAALNDRYRGQNKPTNVLSFPAEVAVPDEEAVILGDLAICLPVVIAESAAQGKTLTDHLTHLFIHGVLHLLGYDHLEEAEADAMEGLETQILAELGISNPYSI